MPERIQLRRTKGWRKPPDAVVVDRRTHWGNPYVILGARDVWWVDTDPDTVTFDNRRDAARRSVDLFRVVVEGERDFWPLPDVVLTASDVREWLAGKDLACWCPLDQPCHADVLLMIANTEEAA